MEEEVVAPRRARWLRPGLTVLVLGGAFAVGVGVASPPAAKPSITVTGADAAPAACTTTFSITGPGGSTSDSDVVRAAEEALLSVDVDTLDVAEARDRILAEDRYLSFEWMDPQQRDLLVRSEAVNEEVSRILAAQGFGPEGYELFGGASC
jgi:hypothetical protein